MDKQALLSLPLPGLPKSRREAVYRTESVQYILRSAVSKGILVVAFYNRQSAANGFSLPTGVLYMGKDSYKTQVTFDGKTIWRDSRVRCALRCSGHLENVCLTKTDEHRIYKYLCEHHSKDKEFYYSSHENAPIDVKIERYQSDILEANRNALKKKGADRIDAKMKEAPKLPKSFHAWIDRWPLLHSRYVYYRRVKKTTAACFCTHCKRSFMLEKPANMPKHNGEGVCPLCGSKIAFKAIGKSAKLADSEHIAILQRTRKGEMLLRFFHVERDFGAHYREPETTCCENGRLFFNAAGKIIGQYKHGWSYHTNRFGWYEVREALTGDPAKIKFQVNLGMYVQALNIWFQPRYLYHDNLHAMLKRLNLSYDIEAMARGRKIDVTSCIFRSMVYPFAPSLAKIGLQQVRDDLLDNYISPVKYTASGPLHVRLGISKRLLRLIRDRCAGMDHEKLIQFGISEKFLKDVKETGFGMDFINLAAMQDQTLKDEELLWFYEKKVKGEHIQLIHNFTTYHKMIKNVIRWAKQKHSNYYNEIIESHQFDLWKDYLEMCKKLGYDTGSDRVLFPKNLQDEHDKLMKLIRIQFDPEIDAKIKALYPSLNFDYHFEDENFLIRPPKDFNEFVDEGTSLIHCVCTNEYYKNHVAGTSFIFFIRKRTAPDTPFYTLEYDANRQKIQQLHGYRNQDASLQVREFVDNWIDQKKSRPSIAA